MNKIPGLVVKAIVNRFSGIRIEGPELTEMLLEYAEKNREHFNFIYTGDSFESPSEGGDRIESPGPADLTPSDPKFTKDQLIRLSKNHLLELAEGMKLVVEGDPNKDALADLIIAEQNRGA